VLEQACGRDGGDERSIAEHWSGAGVGREAGELGGWCDSMVSWRLLQAAMRFQMQWQEAAAVQCAQG